MTNVIDFNERRSKIQSKIDEDFQEEFDDMVIDCAVDITYGCIEILEALGMDIQDPKCANDIVLVVEALKGLIYRANDRTFPTQELSRIIFEIKNPQEFVDDFFDF